MIIQMIQNLKKIRPPKMMAINIQQLEDKIHKLSLNKSNIV